MARRSTGPWYRTGKACWYVWHKGKLVRLHPDEGEAHRIWRALTEGGEVKPMDPVGFSPPPQPTLTVGELVGLYLTDVSLRLKASTVLSKRKVLLRLQRDRGHLPAAALKPAAVMGWLAEQPRWGRSLRWLAGSVVKAMGRWAADPGQGLLPTNPVSGLRLPGPRSRGATAVLSAADHERLLALAPPAYRDVLQALHGTGCRPGELCLVEARHFDPASGAWLLPDHKSDRTGKVRVILLPPAVADLSARLAQRHPTGPLFRSTKGQPLTPERIRLWLYKTCKRHGLKAVCPYFYRHGFATDALASGVPDAHVAELLGHSGTAMLHRHYAHLTARSRTLREALGRVR